MCTYIQWYTCRYIYAYNYTYRGRLWGRRGLKGLLRFFNARFFNAFSSPLSGV